jgi:hypothetical protein
MNHGADHGDPYGNFNNGKGKCDNGSALNRDDGANRSDGDIADPCKEN